MTTAPELTWHQVQAIRRRWQLRNHAAHILADASPTALCGLERPKVTIDPEHRNNPENKPCARCKAAADKRNLPTA